jgi:hypothetical protein
MKLFGREIEGRAQILVILVAVLLLASGLCGAQFAILNYRTSGLDGLVVIFGITGIVELGLMLLSLVGIVVLLITWAISHSIGAGKGATEDSFPSILRVTNRSEEQEKPSSDEAEGRHE